MKYLTGLLQNPAVPISTVYIGTARLCPNPVKYFTVKKVGSLAIISQNPGFIEIQVLELFYTNTSTNTSTYYWLPLNQSRKTNQEPVVLVTCQSATLLWGPNFFCPSKFKMWFLPFFSYFIFLYL